MIIIHFFKYFFHVFVFLQVEFLDDILNLQSVDLF